MLKSKAAAAAATLAIVADAAAQSQPVDGDSVQKLHTTSTSQPQIISSIICPTPSELNGQCEWQESSRTCHSSSSSYSSSSSTSSSTSSSSSSLTSFRGQSSRLITIYSNQHQFYERRRRKQSYNDDHQLGNQCSSSLGSSSAHMHQQPPPCDCYRQISAICRRHKSNMSQGSCSSSSPTVFSSSSSSPLFSVLCGTHRCRHQKEHLPPSPTAGFHHFPHLHSLVFVFCLTVLLHCSQAISRSENASLSSPSSSSSFPHFSALTGRPNFGGGLEFDPRVSAKCERNLMHITVSTEQPFNGIVHVRNYRRNPLCQTAGNGSLLTTLTIDLLAASNRPNYCGVHRVKGSEERSISLVVRLHRALELSDDKHFVITCGNTEFYNKNKNEKLMFKFVDAAGHKVSKLYHGEPYRLRAEIVASSSSSPPPSSQPEKSSSSSSTSHLSSASLAGGGSLATPTTSSSSTSSTPSSYHLYIRNCFIFAGNESDVEFIDANGCPSLSSVFAFRQIGENIAEAEISSMFKLHNSNQVHVQCMVELVANCRFCESTLCPELAAGNDTRKAKMKTVPALQPADMQMLASTTAYVFEPDSLMMGASILGAGVNGAGGVNGIPENCSEWRFPWLIALCIMLGVLLIIMLTVNIFLCTSMSCSCFKQEIIEREPTIIEDYDPYKIDVGFYSPYDSRLSLNRNYHPTAIGGSFAGSGGNDSGEHFFSSSHTAANNNHHHHQHNHGHQHQNGSSSHHHNHRQQSPATATGASNGVTVSHHQPTNHHHQHMLLSSYSPVAESSSAQQQLPPANRPTVAAVRQVANPARTGQQQQQQHLTSRHRQQVPANAATHQQNQPPFDSHSPRSIRSQEFY